MHNTSTNHDNWVISIATGKNQKPLINAAKSLGYKVLGIDIDPNNFIVDNKIEVSTHDCNAVIKKLADHPLRDRIKGVIARTSGPAIVTAAKVARFLEKPGFSVQIAEASLSKFKLWLLCESLGIPAVNTHKIDRIDELPKGGDFIIKPDQPRVGKLNVYRMVNVANIELAFRSISSESLNGTVVVQSYIEGRDIGIAVAASQGTIKNRYFIEEYNQENDGKFTGKDAGLLTLSLSETVKDKLIKYAARLTQKTNHTGHLFISTKVTSSDKVLLYEVNPGLCGDGIAEDIMSRSSDAHNIFVDDVMLMTRMMENIQ